MARHTIIRTYNTMMNRCYNEKDPNYSLYGGAGVRVCDEWKGHPGVFMKWSLENGWSENLELDKDIKGNGLLYSPETACWVTHAENMRHLKSAKKHLFKGKMESIAFISHSTGIPKTTLQVRVQAGYTAEEAVKMGAPKAASGITKFHTYRRKKMTLRQWALTLNISYPLLRGRVNGRGMTLKEALAEPIKTINKTYFNHMRKKKEA